MKYSRCLKGDWQKFEYYYYSKVNRFLDDMAASGFTKLQQFQNLAAIQPKGAEYISRNTAGTTGICVNATNNQIFNHSPLLAQESINPSMPVSHISQLYQPILTIIKVRSFQALFQRLESSVDVSHYKYSHDRNF
jgi:hypothetical protein